MDSKERTATLQEILAGNIANKARIAELNKELERVKGEGRILQSALKALVAEENVRRGKATYEPVVVMNEAAAYQLTIEPTDEPVVGDWGALYAYIKTTGAWELLHKRISQTAIRERWQEGTDVPGIKHNVQDELHIRKLTTGKKQT
jgi:hypothetical protein